MDSINDDIGGESRIGQNLAENPGIAMTQRTHGVECVSSVTGARSDTGASGTEVGIGVAETYTNSTLRRFRDDLYSAWQLRRDRQYANMAARSLPEAIKRSQRGRQKIFRRMHAAPGMADKRPLQMNAQRPGSCLGRAGILIRSFDRIRQAL